MPVPVVSVVMCVYNGERFLKESIESILSQTFKDFEFIIVNDLSNDRSRSIIESFQDQRIRLIDNDQNIGLTKSLNKGIGIARGRYIARMDADDISISERFERQVEMLENNSELVLIGSEIEFITEDGIPYGERGHHTDAKAIRMQLLQGNGGALTHPVVMFRANSFHNVGGYDERFTTSQDLDLFLKLSETGIVTNLTEILLYWRQHQNSINYTKYSTWSKMKALAIHNTIERIGLEEYLAQLFTPEYQTMPEYEKIDIACMALRNKRFSSARKLLINEIKKRGISILMIKLFVATVIKQILSTRHQGVSKK